MQSRLEEAGLEVRWGRGEGCRRCLWGGWHACKPCSCCAAVLCLPCTVLPLQRGLDADTASLRLQPTLQQNVRAEIVVLTRLIPDAHGTSCNERLEPISGCQNARILRVPFRDREG